MTKVVITDWADGDSGEMVDTYGNVRRFRLANVNAPERIQAGYNQSTQRSKRIVKPDKVMNATVTGVDKYGRELIELNDGGRNVNKILEIQNRLFGIKPPVDPKTKRQSRLRHGSDKSVLHHGNR